MSSNSNNGGTGVLTILFLIFLVLKLTDVIDWSWWYVTMPLWGGLLLLCIVLLSVVLYRTFKN